MPFFPRVGCYALPSTDAWAAAAAVTTARDGREALEALRTCDGVDLILTDVVMPQVGWLQHLCVVACTVLGFSGKQTLQAALYMWYYLF